MGVVTRNACRRADAQAGNGGTVRPGVKLEKLGYFVSAAADVCVAYMSRAYYK